MAKAKVLLYDIETAPNLAYVWGKWQQDVVRFKDEFYVICFAYKWLGEKQTHVISLPDFKQTYEDDPTDDYELVWTLHQLFEEADVVIAHNGNAFDQKRSQGRMLAHGFPPPAPYRQIDTLREVKRYFNFNSHKLGDVGKLLGVGNKAETGGFDTWLGCMAGDPKAWAKMCRYNKQDVVLLEKVYLALRPWMVSHPGINNIENELTACPKCGDGPLTRQGTRKTQTASYQQYQCQNCFGWCRSRMAEKTPKVQLV